MPTLRDYQGLAPFSLDELVDAANSVLRERPPLHVTKRTVRYYIQVGVVPPPLGSPKFARYGMDHLLRIVGARCLLDQGMSLHTAGRELERLGYRGLEDAMREVQQMLDGERTEERTAMKLNAPPARVMEAVPRVYSRMIPHESLDIDAVRKVRLTPEATLEVTGSGDMKAVMAEAVDAILKLLSEPPPKNS